MLERELWCFLHEPNDKVRLRPSQTYSVRPGRLHLVTNAGHASATSLVLQGIGECDYVPLR